MTILSITYLSPVPDPSICVCLLARNTVCINSSLPSPCTIAYLVRNPRLTLNQYDFHEVRHTIRGVRIFSNIVIAGQNTDRSHSASR